MRCKVFKMHYLNTDGFMDFVKLGADIRAKIKYLVQDYMYTPVMVFVIEIKSGKHAKSKIKLVDF